MVMTANAVENAVQRGSRFLSAGRFREAMAAAQEAHNLNNQVGGPLLVAAIAAAGLGRNADALRFLDVAAERDPDHPQADFARATVLVRMASPNAVEPAERALELAPEQPEALNLLGRALHLAERFDEALPVFDRAIRAGGAIVNTAKVNKAVVLRALGRLDEAAGLIDGVLDKDPRDVGAWFERASLKRYGPGDPDLDRMRRLLQPGVLGGEDQRMNLLFALGSASLDADPERAFSYLDEANRLKRSGFPFDLEETERFCARIPGLFQRPLFERLKGQGDPSDLPIFIVGMPRSGTSLVEQILASHPAVHGAGETRLFNLAMQATGFATDLPHDTAAFTSPRLRRLAAAYVTPLRELAPQKARVTDKALLHSQTLGFAHLALPNARIVHIRRDPLDTCLSIYAHLFQGYVPYAYDQTELGRYYRVHATLMAHWATVLPAGSFLELDYEALVDDFDAQARRLIAFCGLPWDDACLHFERTQRPVRTASAVQVRRPLYRSSVGRAKRFEPHLQPLLKALR